jgi:anthranilate phosphoribosyltransferase
MAMLQVEDPPESAEMIQRVLSGEQGPARDIVVANAAAALWISGLADSLAIGADRCAGAIDRGQASETLNDLIKLTSRG